LAGLALALADDDVALDVRVAVDARVLAW